MRFPERIIDAFKETPNLLGLASAVALSWALLNPLPLLIGVILEAAYLLFVPDTPWYQRRVKNLAALQREAQRQAEKARILPTVRRIDQERLAVLEQTREEIRRQGAAEMGEWYRDMLAKLDGLLDQYLQFAARAIEYRQYLVRLGEAQAQLAGRPFRVPGLGDRRGGPEGSSELFAREAPADQLIANVLEYFDRQTDRLTHDLEREKDPNVLEVMRKNREVVSSSRESVVRIGTTLRSIENQLDLVANTFTLINTQARTGSPQRMVADVEDVVNQSEALSQAVQDLAPVEEAVARLNATG